MKRIISLTIALCLVLGSFSFVFATATQWDTSDQANLRYIYQSVTSGGSLYTVVNNIYTRVNTISNTLTDIKGYLYQNGHSIAYWVEAINSWMQPIYSHLSDILTQSLNIEAVAGLLGSTEVVDGTTVRTPYLNYQGKSVAEYLYDEMQLDSVNGFEGFAGGRSVSYYYPIAGGTGTQITNNLTGQNWRSNIGLFLKYIGDSQTRIYEFENLGYNSTQNPLSWTDLDSYNSFTATSSIIGVYRWLQNIQAPVARLSYVLASDERIEAQEKAAANEEAVVDNFIDSSGSGSVGVSDFGSLSDASGAMKSNFDTGQSAAGVFNVFDDSHFLYLSQSAADQLDTTGSNNSNRLLKSSGSDYDTPTLDRYYEELNKILEVNKDD